MNYRPIGFGEADIEIEQKMLERDIERAACLYAKSKGVLCYKFTSPAKSGVPDRIMLYEGKVWFIEFKKPDGKLSRLQEKEIQTIQKHGHAVYVCWDLLEAKDVIDQHTR